MFEDVPNFLFHDPVLPTDFDAEDPLLVHPLTHSSIVALQKHSDLLDRDPPSIVWSGDGDLLHPLLVVLVHKFTGLRLSELSLSLTSGSIRLYRQELRYVTAILTLVLTDAHTSARPLTQESS